MQTHLSPSHAEMKVLANRAFCTRMGSGFGERIDKMGGIDVIGESRSEALRMRVDHSKPLERQGIEVEGRIVSCLLEISETASQIFFANHILSNCLGGL